MGPTQRVSRVKRLLRTADRLATSWLDILGAVPPRHYTSKRRATSPFRHNLAQPSVTLIERRPGFGTAYPDTSHNYEDKNTTKISLNSGAGLAQSVQ